jgi:hypothetical protein
MFTGTDILPHSICPHGSHTMSSVVASAAIAGEVGRIPVASAMTHRSANAERRTDMRYRSDAERTGRETEAEETNAPAIETTAVKLCFLTFEMGTMKNFFTPFPTSFPFR